MPFVFEVEPERKEVGIRKERSRVKGEGEKITSARPQSANEDTRARLLFGGPEVFYLRNDRRPASHGHALVFVSGGVWALNLHRVCADVFPSVKLLCSTSSSNMLFRRVVGPVRICKSIGLVAFLLLAQERMRTRRVMTAKINFIFQYSTSLARSFYILMIVPVLSPRWEKKKTLPFVFSFIMFVSTLFRKSHLSRCTRAIILICLPLFLSIYRIL